MRESTIEYVESKFTGGHFALKSERAKVPFTNVDAECKSVKLYADDIVVDIGAYVGEYSIYAAKQGVAKVIAYEPSPVSFEVLKMNKRPQMEIHRKAVIGGDDEEVELFLSSGIGVTNSVAQSYRKSGSITVPAIRYEEAIKDATVVKIDVEGAEYSYQNLIHSKVRAMIIDFHSIKDKDWQLWADAMMGYLEMNDFTNIMRPNIYEKSWTWGGSWIRGHPV